MSKYLNNYNKRRILARLLALEQEGKDKITVEQLRQLVTGVLNANHPSTVTMMIRILKDNGHIRPAGQFQNSIHVKTEHIEALREPE